MSLLGPLFFLSRMAGFTLMIVTIVGAMVYFLARRNETTNGFWTLRAILGYAGSFVLALGLMNFSVGMMMLGSLMWIASMFVDRTKVAPPPAV